MFNKNDCSPHNKGVGTCIPKKYLVKIGKILNNNFNCSINVKCSKNKIYKLITKELLKMSKCNREACWLNIYELKDGFSNREYEKLKGYFRPFMPESWENEPKKWLNTTDINNVLDQYALKYPKFKYMGASPIDYHLKSKTGKCIVNELCNLDLKEIRNENYESIGVIFNTDSHNQPGQHWFSIFIDLKGKNLKNKPAIYHFDSAAGEPTEEILNLVNTVQSQYKDINNGKEISFIFNDKEHQKENTECGIYCLHFLIYMLQGKDFKKYVNTKKTDRVMFKFRDKFFIKCKK